MASAPCPFGDNLNNLERSFAAIAANHRLTSFAVAYRGEQFGPEYRFTATAHFDDAAVGQIPCASGDGQNTESAIRALLGQVEAKRRTPLTGDDALYGDDSLVAEAA